MVKSKTKWVCQNCGYETARYLGKCPECNEWDSFIEQIEEKNKSAKTNAIQSNVPIYPINSIILDNKIRFTTGFDEFDRVLGGGIVEGSTILLAGNPGIGKSTLVLQTAKAICEAGKKTLYVCAEESASQLKLRAERLGVSSDNLFVYSQTSLNELKEQIENNAPDFLIIDSIQAVYTDEISGGAGNISQIRECTNILNDLAKSKNIATIIVGHVTKDGNIAGPKVLEHMVDVVLYFEGDKSGGFRILRGIKNRFGCTSEIGILSMDENGLNDVSNPSELFLGERQEVSGSTAIVTCEGTRTIMTEVQALVSRTFYPNPRRVTNGMDYSRLLQIIAVIEKRVGLDFSKYDVFVNITGGIEIDEPAIDLGVAMAIITSLRDAVISKDTAIIGELGLSGEIRKVSNMEKRISEAERSGFKRIFTPKFQQNKNSKIEVIQVNNIRDAIKGCLDGINKSN